MVANKKKLLEALLFLDNNPIPLTELEEMLETTTLELSFILEDFEKELSARDSALELSYIEDKIYLRPKSEFTQYLAHIYGQKEKRRFSKASLEVLSIIAWKQPVTRSEIDDIRGVDSSNSLKNLLEEGLVKVVGKKEIPGRPQTYGTTDHFLKYFGLNSLEELPRIDDLKEMFEN